MTEGRRDNVHHEIFRAQSDIEDLKAQLAATAADDPKRKELEGQLKFAQANLEFFKGLKEDGELK